MGETPPVEDVARDVVGDATDREVGVGVREHDVDLARGIEFADAQGGTDAGVASADNDDPAHRRLAPHQATRNARCESMSSDEFLLACVFRFRREALGWRLRFVAEELVGEGGEGRAVTGARM